MKRVATFLFGVAAADAVAAGSYRPEITGFQSKEQITHLAPGGANAAREIDITVQLFDGAGRAVQVAGEPVELIARDIDAGRGTPVGRLSGVTRADGTFAGRMILSECRSPNIKGPIRVHRISNKPEYWDVTYADASIDAVPSGRLLRFVHVCKETYRGYRP